MIFISDVIKNLERIKEKEGDIPVLTACQVRPNTVDFRYEVETFSNELNTTSIKVLVVKGYRE